MLKTSTGIKIGVGLRVGLGGNAAMHATHRAGRQEFNIQYTVGFNVLFFFYFIIILYNCTL